MHLLTLLRHPLRLALERAGAAGMTYHHADHGGALLAELRDGPWTALVVDPTLISESGAATSIVAYVRESRAGLLLLAPVGHDSYSAVTRCARLATPHTGIDVLFSSAERDVGLTRAKLHALAERSAMAHLLGALAQKLAPLPATVEDGFVSLFGTLPLPTSAEVFADQIPIVRRSLDRHFKRAGLRPAARCIDTVRLGWAWDLVHSSGAASHDEVATLCGYASTQSLRDHAREVLGRDLLMLARTSPSELAIERLAAHAVGRSAQPRADDDGEVMPPA